MIDPDAEAIFPNNVVKCLAIVYPGIDEDLTVLTRPLRPTDPHMSLGIYPMVWTPNDDSVEMKGTYAVLGGGPAEVPGPIEPTLSNYQIGIQTLVKDGDTERALAVASILNKRVRSVLYRNEPLRVALASLYAEDGDSVERMKGWKIRSQRYMSNDIEGKFVFISVLDLQIETETS